MVVLREQLIAVLGHDLRNPLSAITMAVELMSASLGAEEALIMGTIKRSTLRMAELVDNIMDFARTRLGEGIVLNRQQIVLRPVLEQVADELRLTYPNRAIDITCSFNELVFCDADRVAQLVSNLVANAITHGSHATPVLIEAFYNEGNLEICVTNNGVPIAADMQEQLFTPFTRESSRPSQNGLGLGLYIASEIARAHHGTLTCTSTHEKTCFTLRMNA